MNTQQQWIYLYIFEQKMWCTKRRQCYTVTRSQKEMLHPTWHAQNNCIFLVYTPDSSDRCIYTHMCVYQKCGNIGARMCAQIFCISVHLASLLIYAIDKMRWPIRCPLAPCHIAIQALGTGDRFASGDEFLLHFPAAFWVSFGSLGRKEHHHLSPITSFAMSISAIYSRPARI